MNPVVGITKILNNLQECLDIIEKIDTRNKIILPNLQYIEDVMDVKRKLINLLQDGKLDKIEKIAQMVKETENITDGTDNIISFIEHFSPYHKKILEEFDASLDSIILRVKKLSGEERIAWFESWPRNQWQMETFKGIVTSYCSWEYPSMEIFPGNGEMLPFALSAEPLYLVDWDETLLQKVTSQFNSYYANKRVMKYTIKEYDLSPLPKNSFGFVYCINWLMFEQLERLVDLAKNVYDCLMPGGVYFFYYNNSDDYWSVTNFDYYNFGLVDSKELTEHLKKIGFEIIDNVRSKELNTSYILCKKPGDIEYIKNSSVLGNIIDKPNDLM